MLNFKEYKPSYIPEPIDQISKTMAALDQNNQRITQGYDNLTNALYSLDINELDTPIVADTQTKLTSGMNQLLNTNDYSKISGGLTRLAREAITNNTGLKAAAIRNAEYNKKRDLVEQLYYKGGANSIDKEQYDYYMQQSFKPTMADEHGRYDNEYREFDMPVKAVDINTILANGVRNVGIHSRGGNQITRYLTKGEIAKIYNYEIDPAIADESSGIIDKESSIQSSYKNERDIREALTGLLTTDPDAKAYIEDLAKIRKSTPAKLIEEFIQPHLKSASSSVIENVTDHGSKLKSDIEILRARSKANEALMTARTRAQMERDQQKADGKITDNPFKIGTILNKNADEFKVKNKFYNSSAPGSPMGKFNMPANIDLSENQDESSYYDNLHIDAEANNLFNKSFNDLTKSQREKVLSNLNNSESRNIMLEDINVDGYENKYSDERSNMIVGGTSLNFKKGSGAVTGTASQTGLYNLSSGEYVSPNIIDDYFAKLFEGKDEVKISTLGKVFDDTPQLASLTGDYSYITPELINIGGVTFAVPDQSKSIRNPAQADADKFEVLVSDIGKGKRSHYKTVRFGNEMHSIQYKPQDDAYYITSEKGRDGFIIKNRGNNVYGLQLLDMGPDNKLVPELYINAPTETRALALGFSTVDSAKQKIKNNQNK